MTNLKDRISRLISGSVHSLIEAVEDRSTEMVMEEAIREVEVAILEVRAELGKASAARYLASKRLAEMSEQHDDLTDQAGIAVSEGRHDLAEVAIARQIDMEAEMPTYEQAIQDAAEHEAQLEEYVSALNEKRAEMIKELKALRVKLMQAPSETVIDASGNPSVLHEINQSISSATAAFDRASQYDSNVSSSMSEAGKLAELKELARRSEIEKRLEKLKHVET